MCCDNAFEMADTKANDGLDWPEMSRDMADRETRASAANRVSPSVSANYIAVFRTALGDLVQIIFNGTWKRPP